MVGHSLYLNIAESTTYQGCYKGCYKGCQDTFGHIVYTLGPCITRRSYSRLVVRYRFKRRFLCTEKYLFLFYEGRNADLSTEVCFGQ